MHLYIFQFIDKFFYEINGFSAMPAMLWRMTYKPHLIPFILHHSLIFIPLLWHSVISSAHFLCLNLLFTCLIVAIISAPTGYILLELLYLISSPLARAGDDWRLRYISCKSIFIMLYHTENVDPYISCKDVTLLSLSFIYFYPFWDRDK